MYFLAYDTTTNTEILNTLPKRKRVRFRKRKTKFYGQLTKEKKPVKSKITNSINSSIISRKHIGFDRVDDKIVVKDRVICPSNQTVADTVHKLENILLLVRGGIPFIVEYNITHEEDEEKNSAEGRKPNIISINFNQSTPSMKRLKENKGTDFETYKVMIEKPKIKDIIAFQVIFLKC